MIVRLEVVSIKKKSIGKDLYLHDQLAVCASVPLLYHGNVSISHPYVSREQRRLAQARLRPGLASAQVCSGVLRPAYLPIYTLTRNR